MSLPKIIQGGMGVGVSNWRLARTVSSAGHLGVVSGTALDVVLARRLQLGDEGGHLQRAFAKFPVPRIAAEVWRRYFIPGGKSAEEHFRTTPQPSPEASSFSTELTVLANFVEVFLAKEGHSGVVGINFLYKIQSPILPSLFGAMLAGVDFVLMGAGIPMAIPGALDALAQGQVARMPLDVLGATEGEGEELVFDPAQILGDLTLHVQRPKFLAIVSSHVLAAALARKATGRVDGFVVEGSRAGGHNAPPRGAPKMNERGEPVYGPRDEPDAGKLRELGLPFWMAGDYASPERLAEALRIGAAGIQVGTAFAFCDESGIDSSLKRRVLEACLEGRVDVFTDPLASPTGFPFKIVRVEGTVSEPEVYDERQRVCDLGYLRHAYRRADGSIGQRCPGEPIEHYLAKEGRLEDTPGRKCLCNGLLATIGLGQVQRQNYHEPALVTAGDDLAGLRRFFPTDAPGYSALDVLRVLLSPTTVVPAM